MAKASYKLSIGLIPKPLHGVNLRAVSALGQNGWTKLRAGLLEERGLRCETCGKALQESKQVKAHELWAYDTSHTPAVARITGIILSCWLCHAVEHFMFTMLLAGSKGLSDAVPDTIAHFCRVNGASEADFNRHLEKRLAEWKALSSLEWTVDYGPYAAMVADNQSKRSPSPVASPHRSSKVPRDPYDRNRMGSFQAALTDLCEFFGYWIGQPGRRSELPIHIREPGEKTSGYNLKKYELLPLVEGATWEKSLRIVWRDDPMLVPLPKRDPKPRVSKPKAKAKPRARRR